MRVTAAQDLQAGSGPVRPEPAFFFAPCSPARSSSRRDKSTRFEFPYFFPGVNKYNIPTSSYPTTGYNFAPV